MNVNLLNIFRKKKIIRLTEFIDSCCNKSKRGKTYVRQYRRLSSLLRAFEASLHREIYTDSFNDETVEEYIHFIQSSQPLKKGRNAYRQGTIRNFVQKTLTMLNKAARNGYKVELESFKRLKLPDEDCEAVYITMEELGKINNLSLKNEMAQIRDIFLIGCCTALRYSDYSRLSMQNFQQNGNINILTKKTNTKVSIPIHYLINDIIARNEGYDFLKYQHSQQNFNKKVKTICKKAGLNDRILVERTEGLKKVRRIYKKYELVSSHTARRTGATNMYLANIPTYRIMLITGHKTEAAFYRYIRIRKEENAIFLQQHPFFCKELNSANNYPLEKTPNAKPMQKKRLPRV